MSDDNNQDDNQKVIDGEVVVKNDSPTTPADDFLNLEGLVKSYVAKIETLEKELKEKSQMLKDAFESDAVYQEHAEKAKEANKIKAATKNEILKQPALKELSEKIKEMKFDLQEQRVVLADYLQQYQQQTKATQIELENGEVMEIVTVTKLVKLSTREER